MKPGKTHKAKRRRSQSATRGATVRSMQRVENFETECRAVGIQTVRDAVRFFGVGRATIFRWRQNGAPAIVGQVLRYMRVTGVSAAAFDAITSEKRP
jgi:hypothetical protein